MCPWPEGIWVTGGFWLLAAWFALSNGWRLLAVTLSAAALHELGHLLALYLLGGRVTGLRLSAFGAELATDAARLPYLRETGVVLAGPAVNLALGLLLARLGQYTASGAHLSLCLFNLLPVRPLDGGRALCLLASWLLGPERGEAAARWGGALTALPVGCAGLWLTGRTGGSLWLLPASWGLLAAGLRELAGGARGIFCKKPLHF